MLRIPTLEGALEWEHYDLAPDSVTLRASMYLSVDWEELSWVTGTFSSYAYEETKHVITCSPYSQKPPFPVHSLTGMEAPKSCSLKFLEELV